MDGISGLIIPGGESTTMLHFLLTCGWEEALTEFGKKGGCIFGTCAGAILLAREVSNPPQASLGLADVSISRNAYGRQVHSFVAKAPSVFGCPEFEMVFIRAPRIERTGPLAKTLAELGRSPVLVQDGRHLLATFHPELTTDLRIHNHFLSMTRGTL
jgi:5'-phosphate synthase pdxT subunit